MKRLLTPGTILIVLALAAYIWLIHDRASPFVGGSDSAGYYNNALLLAQGRIKTDQRTLPGLPPSEAPKLYVPLGFTDRAGGNSITPTYPIGLPLLAIATAQVTGWEWVPGWTAGWHLLLGVLLFYPLCRCFGLDKYWALLGTLILALSPLSLFMGLQFMSDFPALTWCAAAMLFALLSSRHTSWALAAGASFAIAVLVRPTNAILLPSLAMALGLGWKRWICLILGGLPGAIAFAFHNFHAYGGVFTSGYGTPIDGFSWAYVIPSLKNYVRNIPLLFTPLVLLALAVPLLWKQSVKKTAILIVWPLSFLAFYSAYYCTHEVWWYLRFILPAAPPLIVGALCVAQQACQKHGYTPFAREHSPRMHCVSALIFIACLAFHAAAIHRFNAFTPRHDERIYYMAAAWLNQNAPAGSCVLAMQNSGSLFAYTPFTVLRWDYIDVEKRPLVAEAVAKNRHPLYAVLHHFEEQDAFTRYPGNWREVYQFKYVKIWLYEGPPS